MSEASEGGPAEPAEAPAKKRKRLSPKKRALFSCLTLAILIGVPELFFQVREVVRKRRRPTLPTQADAYRDLTLVKGARYKRPERSIEINSLGFRGEEIKKEKTRTRIYCAGGSTTFGLYASANDKTWPSRLQAELRAKGHDLEVINGGAPGWTTRTSMTHLELVGFELKPDVLVIYHAYNDLVSNLEERYWKDSEVEDVKKLYRPKSTPLLGHSALFRFVRSRFRDPYDKLKVKEDRLTREGVAAFERNLRRLIRRAREQGAKVVVCTFPSCFRETEKASADAKVPDLHKWYGALSPISYPKLYAGLLEYNEVIRKVTTETKVPLVDLAKSMSLDVGLYKSPIHHSDPGEDYVAQQVLKAIQGVLPEK